MARVRAGSDLTSAQDAYRRAEERGYERPPFDPASLRRGDRQAGGEHEFVHSQN